MSQLFSYNINIEMPGYSTAYVSVRISFDKENRMVNISTYNRPSGHVTVITGRALGIRWIDRYNIIRFELLFNGQYPIQRETYELHLSGNDFLQLFNIDINFVHTRIKENDEIIYTFRNLSQTFNIKNDVIIYDESFDLLENFTGNSIYFNPNEPYPEYDENNNKNIIVYILLLLLFFLIMVILIYNVISKYIITYVQ
ncbi:hypothetical protein [Alphaentomopoxvirus acuprea]|uniref:Uncharacterized protein n=1 Tax=Alphaentomopoxvirus acuprea TaxID=62099 RepID=W6JPK2_9POXV|nr:hypothetical protein BA82_gp064 [Anomala cuprea entomopoxvirus]BAO49424.1 hypothetical protein [Anomala cuprea entomopoxvirus]